MSTGMLSQRDRFRGSAVSQAISFRQAAIGYRCRLMISAFKLQLAQANEYASIIYALLRHQMRCEFDA